MAIMLSNLAIGFLLSSTIAVVSGQSSSAFDTSAFYNAIPSVLAIPSVQSALEAQATAIATNPTLLAALSSVPGISTKDVPADLASAFDEVAEGQTTLTASSLQYLNAIPSTGAANDIVNSAINGVILSGLNDNPELFSKTSVSFYIATGSQASGAANPTGVAGTASQASGAVRSTVVAETASPSSGAAKSSGAAGANSTGAQSSVAAATTVQPKTSTSSTSSAPEPQSTNGGGPSQPTGAIMAAGAAAAGILGFAAFL